jgi:FkbM family methyltransferase
MLNLEKILLHYTNRLAGKSVWLKGSILRSIWLLPESMRQPSELRSVLNRLAKLQKSVFFLNIGANDGLSNDPLREFVVGYQWSGIMVEPVGYVFRRLQRAYCNFGNVILENAALAEQNGVKEFWYLKPSKMMELNYDQMGSFSKEHLMKFDKIVPNLEGRMVKESMKCITLASLLEKHHARSPDLIHVDTEGYDFEVLKQIDFSVPPKVIVFEHEHLSKADLKASHDLLMRENYLLAREGGNTIAYKNLPAGVTQLKLDR